MTKERKESRGYGKSRWRWAALAAAVLGGVMLAFEGVAWLLVWLLTQSIEETEAVGIIGGADGPTAIFVTTTTGVPDWVIWALLLVLCLVGWRKLSHCRQKDHG